MSTTLVRLTLVFPTALESAITEALIEHPTSPGFTLLHAEGHGSDFQGASVAEQVRGRIARRVLWMVLRPEQSEAIVAALREQIPSHDVRWWEEPVTRHGRLA